MVVRPENGTPCTAAMALVAASPRAPLKAAPGSARKVSAQRPGSPLGATMSPTAVSPEAPVKAAPGPTRGGPAWCSSGGNGGSDGSVLRWGRGPDTNGARDTAVASDGSTATAPSSLFPRPAARTPPRASDPASPPPACTPSASTRGSRNPSRACLISSLSLSALSHSSRLSLLAMLLLPLLPRRFPFLPPSAVMACSVSDVASIVSDASSDRKMHSTSFSSSIINSRTAPDHLRADETLKHTLKFLRNFTD